jgi:hypothetical protein
MLLRHGVGRHQGAQRRRSGKDFLLGVESLFNALVFEFSLLEAGSALHLIRPTEFPDALKVTLLQSEGCDNR